MKPDQRKEPGVRRETRYAPTPFGDNAYTEHGSGAPALFVLGILMNDRLWRHVIDRVTPVGMRHQREHCNHEKVDAARVTVTQRWTDKDGKAQSYALALTRLPH